MYILLVSDQLQPVKDSCCNVKNPILIKSNIVMKIILPRQKDF